jgi:hypothetical protein
LVIQNCCCSLGHLYCIFRLPEVGKELPNPKTTFYVQLHSFQSFQSKLGDPQSQEMQKVKQYSKRTLQRKIKRNVQEHLLDLAADVQNDTNNTINLRRPNDIVQQPRPTTPNLSDNPDSSTKSDVSKVDLAPKMFDAMSEQDIAGETFGSDDEVAFEKEFNELNNPCSESDESGDEVSYKSDACPPNAKVELADWATTHNVAHATLSDLLLIIRKWIPELPKDPRTLLSTPRESDVSVVAGGSYFYFGLQKTLNNVIDTYKLVHELDNEQLSLLVNIDGIPLFKSCNTTLWPILCTVKEFPSVVPFAVALYCGSCKPSSVDSYLHDFVSELKLLIANGIVLNNRSYRLSIYAIICDAPARSLFKCIKGHCGYNSCERCIQAGKWIKKMTFPFVKSPLRTDSDFNEMTHSAHHTGRSPFCDVPVAMVTQWPLDYMHLVCLGVVRRLIMLWVKGPRSINVKLSMQQLSVISDRMVSLRCYIPREFARKPRSLVEVSNWKATEFRLFLLYVGPVVLLDILPEVRYINFLTLSVAIRLCLTPNVCARLVDYAERLLLHFVETFSSIYGEGQLVYNVHGLLHLVDDVRLYGSLDNVSAFQFESYLGTLKKKVRSPRNPVTQIIRRISEENAHRRISKEVSETPISSAFKILHCDGPLPVLYRHCSEYKHFTGSEVFISACCGDNCCEVRGKFGLVRNILFDDSTIEGFLVFEEFELIEPFFLEPLSSDTLSIHYASRLSGTHAVYPLSGISNKYMALPFKNGYALFTLLHNSKV